MPQNKPTREWIQFLIVRVHHVSRIIKLRYCSKVLRVSTDLLVLVKVKCDVGEVRTVQE